MKGREVAPAPLQRHYRFGEFVLDLDAGFLRRDGVEVPLRRKAFDVLTYLVQRHGKLVSKHELVEAVWPDSAVTDNSLAQCLSEIRRALDAERDGMIRTVARRGYVFEAAVSVPITDIRRTGSEDALEQEAADLPSRPALQAVAVRADTPPAKIAAEPRQHRPRGVRSRWVSVASAAVLILALVAIVAWKRRVSAIWVPEPPLQLTDFNDSAVSPSLSHDGRMLAFIRGGHFGTTASPRGELFVKMLITGRSVQLTADGMTKDHPRFSPDDSRIIYTTFEPPLRWDSMQVPVLGGPPRPFLPNGSGVTWLNEGHVLYSTVMTGVHMGLASSTESRANYQEIYFPRRHDGMVHRSEASPDRTSLLAVEMTSGTWLPCRLLPADGSSEGRVVGPPAGQCTSAAWSPDGRWMYFSSNVGGAFHIWRQRFPEGAPEQITFGPTEQEGTAITPDGKYLITSMGLQQASISLQAPEGEQQLTEEGVTTQPTMLRSGKQMLYLVRTALSRGQESGELWSVDLIGGVRQRLLPDIVMASYSLSHDEQMIVYTVASGNQSDGVWIADLDRRSPPRQLASGADLRAFFGASGEIIYAAEDGRLYRIRTDGSGKQLASSEPVAYLTKVSPDGRWAVAVVPHGNGAGDTRLRFIALRADESFDVCDGCSAGPRSFLAAAPFNWSADGKLLLVNLVYFVGNVRQTAILPYRTEEPASVLWPRGLGTAKNVISNPGVTTVGATFTFPASGASTVLTVSRSMRSNLYRVRLPE